jgi:hypothetical protein
LPTTIQFPREEHECKETQEVSNSLLQVNESYLEAESNQLWLGLFQ